MYIVKRFLNKFFNKEEANDESICKESDIKELKNLFYKRLLSFPNDFEFIVFKENLEAFRFNNKEDFLKEINIFLDSCLKEKKTFEEILKESQKKFFVDEKVEIFKK